MPKIIIKPENSSQLSRSELELVVDIVVRLEKKGVDCVVTKKSDEYEILTGEEPGV